MATSTLWATSTSPSSCTSDHHHTLRQTQHLKPLSELRLKFAPAPGSCKRICTPSAHSTESSAAGASTDSGHGAVAVRRASPLTRGGTLTGEKASGKDPGLAILAKSPTRVGSNEGPFQDARWSAGTWDIQQFTGPNGKVDWDAIIDAEVLRRKWLEDNPEASLNEDPVVFETSVIPWWAWMRRFHLPEAELMNGRAAMIGFFVGYVVDGMTGVGLVDQTSSLIGKTLLFVCVMGVLLIRKSGDVDTLKQLVQEWNFYDKQWQASWQDEQSLPSLKVKE